LAQARLHRLEELDAPQAFGELRGVAHNFLVRARIADRGRRLVGERCEKLRVVRRVILAGELLAQADAALERWLDVERDTDAQIDGIERLRDVVLRKRQR